MKLRNYQRMSKKLRSQITEAIDLHTSMKNSYFWSPPSNASGRRRMESQKSLNFEFIFKGDHYSVTLNTRCSCRKVRYSSDITVNGNKKTIRSLKTLVGA
mgnify:FL=1